MLEDNSQTYALIRSTSAAITQEVDYDTVGAYENSTNQAIGTGVGILDQLPAGAVLVDSVGVVEGGGSDRDRTLTTEALNHPGIHVHQPTRYTGPNNDVPNTTNVTSDAVSRLAGVTIPNSIGVWWNGDIPDGDAGGPIEYLNDSFNISVVAPDGSVLTPGSPNTLRTVFFSLADQQTEVAEASGSVTVNIERTGDLNEVITVDYATVDLGSATPNTDFTSVSSSVTFGVGESVKPVTVTILGDSTAEGFERFGIDITAVDDPRYLITNGKPNETGAINGESVVTIADANVSIATFQEGVDGYTGTEDAYLDGENIGLKFGQDPVIRVDQVKGEGEDVAAVVRPQQGLIKFDDIFGNAVGQIPEGSTIFGGFLTVNVQNPSSGADVRFFEMLQDWEQVNATWADPQGSRGSSIFNGVTPDDVEASAIPDAVVPDPGRAGLVEIPLNADTIQAWANGSAENNGWSIVTDSGSLWAFNSSDAFLPGTVTPELTILYTDPIASDPGTFGLAEQDFLANEDGTGEFTIQRVGGSNGSVSVDWALTGITGDASDISGALSGSVTFAPGELTKTVSVALNDDAAVESNETFGIALSGSGISLGRDAGTLTIRDNDFNPFGGDLLLNEMWINSPGNDPPYEFVELKGTPGVGMGSLYYVAIEGIVGDREGSAEKVVDLGAYQNGSAASDGNGYTLLTPDAADFGFRVPAGTTQVPDLGSVAQENVSSQNDSTTYLLLYSPFTSLTTTEFDYDWDNDGALELPAGVQIVDTVGVRVLGENDQLYGPSNSIAEFASFDPDVDAISRFRTDTNRNEGDAWFGGDLVPAGDDYLLYETAEAFDLPVSGAALTPGEPNVGNASESPLVSLLSVMVNPDGTVTASFSGPVSQINVGTADLDPVQGEGISVTDTSSQPAVGVNFVPTVAGLGTSNLTLSFTGDATVGGGLPAGDYNINFVGNGIIGNGRAVDVDGDGASLDSFTSETIMVSGVTVTGDFNNDGNWDCDDINALSAEVAGGTNNASFDMNGDGLVTLDDITGSGGWLTVGGANNADATGGNPFLNGDANLDGSVDGQDFLVWNDGKFTSNNAWCDGDFNADGDVNGGDFLIWNGNKFLSSSIVANDTNEGNAAVGGALEVLTEGDDKSLDSPTTELAIARRLPSRSSEQTQLHRRQDQESELATVDSFFEFIGKLS